MNQEYEKISEEILKYISSDTRNILKMVTPQSLETIEEIRLRANRPLMLHTKNTDWFVDCYGNLKKDYYNSYVVTKEDISRSLEHISENSIYAFQEDIKNGFITLRGGHRVGIAGRVIFDGKAIKNIKEFSGLNIRISREISGCSDKLMQYILKGSEDVCSTLIISPPQCGKTTILRDIARNISDGFREFCFNGLKVGIIDERSEIASCYKGVPQNHIGLRTDVLDACPKAVGMDTMIRSMSPQVIITDEIGNEGDKASIKRVINAGVKIIASAHGYNISELKSRQEVIGLIEEKVFERYIVLSSRKGPGTLEEIIDKNMKVLFRRDVNAA
jgi:stage III sporulation protein AA